MTSTSDFSRHKWAWTRIILQTALSRVCFGVVRGLFTPIFQVLLLCHQCWGYWTSTILSQSYKHMLYGSTSVLPSETVLFFEGKKVLVLWFNPVLRAKCWKAQCYFRRPSTDVSLQITFHPRWKKWKALDVLWHIYQTSGCSYTRAITIISQDYWTLNVLQSLRTHSEQREYNPHAPICSHYAS